MRDVGRDDLVLEKLKLHRVELGGVDRGTEERTRKFGVG